MNTFPNSLFCHIKQYITSLIGAALNVRHITIGSSTDINDACLEAARSTNQLCKLEELKVSKGGGLSTKSLYSLVEHCPNLTSIHGIEYWEGVSEQVIG